MKSLAAAAVPETHDLAARITVVVPTLNEAETLGACLGSLMTPGTEEVRFVVSDGGSTDGTRVLAERLADDHRNLFLHRNERRVQAAAVNEVARQASADRDILVRCDAHATYPLGFVLGVAEALLARGAVSLVVPMDTAARPGAGCFERANAFAVSTPLGTGGSAHRGGRRSGWVDHGHHAGLARDAFLAVGGYDEGLPANEDAELDTRLARAGGGVWLEASLRPTYHPRARLRGLWQQYRRYGEGRAIHARRHGTGLRPRQAIPAFLVPVLAASALLGALWPPALSVPLGYVALLALASLWLGVRHRSLCGLLSGFALGAMHTAWSLGFWRGWCRR